MSNPFIAADPRTDERFVYFIEAEGLGLVKIGVANCPHDRLRHLDHMSAAPLRLLGAVATDRRGALEKELHLRFAAHRRRGEWFEAHPEIMAYIEAHASMPRPPRRGPGGVRLLPGQPRPLTSGAALAQAYAA